MHPFYRSWASFRWLASLCVAGGVFSCLQASAGDIAQSGAELRRLLKADEEVQRRISDLEQLHGAESREVRAAWDRRLFADAQNTRRLESIIEEHGWPDPARFGDEAAAAALRILQRADVAYQVKFLPVLRAAASRGEVPLESLAFLEDRIQLRLGLKQIYGTQVTRNAAGKWVPLPIEDERTVDSRRKRVGLPPMREYLKSFAVYDVRPRRSD